MRRRSSFDCINPFVYDLNILISIKMNTKISTLLFLLSLSLTHTSAISRGINLPTAFNNFSCIKTAGYSFVITKAWDYTTGSFEASAVTNIKNARNANIPFIDVYMQPCRNMSSTW